MDAAKASVKNFMSKAGHHDTTIHEKVAPSVTNETVARTQHESQTTAVDREVHQDHYHTSEQPVSHSEVLAEQHHHKAAPVEHRSFEHDNPDKIKRGLEDERMKYRDTQTRVEGERTREENPTVQGEHVHHHVHETIQPVVNKQTIEPHVVHTTVPIHEVHHNEAHHHASSALPAMSMDDFKKQGGALGGREERSTYLAGEPRSFGGHDVQDECGPGAGTTDHSGLDGRTQHATTDRIGTDPHTQPGYGSNERGTPIADQYNSRSGNTSDRIGTDGQLPGSNNHSFGTTEPEHTSSSQQKKPSLMDKLNPRKDANGDGKAGFMK